MSLTVDGNNITFTGTVTVVNGANQDSGTAYLVLTPEGGFGTLPFLATGDPGKPPVFDSFTMEEVDPDDPLPTPNPEYTLVSPGGPGEASHYTLKFYVHKGATGATGTFTISGATDLSGTPGSGNDKQILVYRHSDGKWVLSAQKVGDQYVPAAIASTSFSVTTPRTLTSVTIPAQPFDWRPRVFAQTVVTGSADTRVDLVARVGNASSGAQVGFSKGLAGAAPPPNILIPAAPAGSSMPGSYGRVAAGDAATIYLVAEQKAPSSNSWSTPASPDTTFWVEVAPLP
ncbi:hypothetical protein [Mycobacterium phage WXIN]|nr:hypothetical protein [Mycobacterium phage WXIN]